MIPRRDIQFDLDAATTPRDWVADDPFFTSFVASLSLLFPEGEKFFIDSVKQLRHEVTSEELDADIDGFVGQEAMHGREHRALNKLLVEHGYRGAPGVERWLRRFLRMVRKVLSRKSQLAATCALEHFTATLAESLLRDPRLQAELAPEVRPVWLWHALEETEHKAVAYDVYVAAGGGYVRRVSIMLLTTAAFFAALGIVHVRMMGSRGVLWRPWRWGRGLARMWLWPAYFTRLIPAYLSYYRPGFHPHDRDTRSLVAAWQGRLFGRDRGGHSRLRRHSETWSKHTDSAQNEVQTGLTTE